MTKKEIHRIYMELCGELTSEEFLEAAGLQRETVEMVLNREYWEAQLASLFPIRKRISCRRIFEMCRPTMLLLGREPEEGWMSFTYKFVCRLLYPEDAFAEKYGQFRAGAVYYLHVMRFLFDRERQALPFEPLTDFGFVDDEEGRRFENYREYKKFLRHWRSEYIYEMMRLNGEVTKFRTLEHIAGVHYVAMTVARGLLAAGAPVDLTLVSGSAAAHDLGKFGCKPNEKVPFMHYYYTANWCERHDLPGIGHIAANHSTWDLESDNLAAESLCLIYSDFRVKSSRGADGVEITHISSIKDAFEVILHKLENVDAEKFRRYRFVYAKLADFEDYMRAHGVDVDLDGHPAPAQQLPQPGLRTPAQTVQALVHMALEHNMDVMHRLNAEKSFSNLLEAARSEKNWKNVRAYLHVLREYYAYTGDAQKEQALSFLYELFMHRDGEIRVQAAELFGEIIVGYNAGYRKRRPEGMADVTQERMQYLWKHYLERIIRPDPRLIDLQQRRIRSQLKNIAHAMREHAEDSDVQMFLEALMEWYRDPEQKSAGEQFVLMNCAEVLPFEDLDTDAVRRILRFALYCAKSEDKEARTAAWRAIGLITWFAAEQGLTAEQFPMRKETIDVISSAPTEESVLYSFIKYRIFHNLGLDTAAQEKILYGSSIVTDVFLENLKTDTPWIQVAVNIRLLEDQVQHGDRSHALHIAAHFSNLIKVGRYLLVRNAAGEALVGIAPLLRIDQRNEIAVEMLRGLETGETDYSSTIPRWLGQLALWLPPEQLDELIASLESMQASPSDHVTSVALDTVGTLLEYYPRYAERFEEDRKVRAGRWKHLIGLLLQGMASYREPVRQEALLVLGQSVFGSKHLTRLEKRDIFLAAAGRIDFQMNENRGDGLTNLYRAASLSSLYRYITEYRLLEGEFESRIRSKVAFFPGTFDPFTLSHKGITKMIADMGFEVYLSVDEFSWSKRAQPHFIRRQIVNMSIAGQYHVNLFPYEIPINPGNPEDLERLEAMFPGREVYLVVGSDVVAHASFYKKSAHNDKVRSMNHIVIRRVGDREADSGYNHGMLDCITGRLIELELPAELEEISSSRIRENIDQSRDISDLIDPVVQEYIYNNGLYLHEPEFKPVIEAGAVTFEETDQPDPAIPLSVREPGDRLLLLRNETQGDRPTGAIRIRYIAPEDLYTVIRDVQLCDIVQRRSHGKILMITGLCTDSRSSVYDTEQLLLTEAVMRSFAEHCDYAIFMPEDCDCPDSVYSAIRRQGFRKPEEASGDVDLYVADMHAPLILLANMEATLKEPFSSNERVLRVIRKTQQKLQLCMTDLYPGNLVISVSGSVLYHRLVDRIITLNDVPRQVQVPRQLGEMMCVPFGKILRGSVVPNTVTKTLHTDRVYEPDLSACSVEAYPNYTPLETQVRAIKSFRRPAILVDDVLNRSGVRITAIAPLLRKEGVSIRTILLGIITGYGKNVLASMGLEADWVYYVPNIRNWFMESSLYPFIGGDQVRRRTMKVAGLVPSVNFLQPYAQPLLPDTSEEAQFAFSECCIQNARDVLAVLEEEYRKLFSRNLTLSRLSEAVNMPLCPDRGTSLDYNPNLPASVYLENDLEMLYRSRVKRRP